MIDLNSKIYRISDYASFKHRTLSVILLVLFSYIFIMNAWVCDDAYISFRTIDNFIHGCGLTWNAGERVQSFTHPLWVLILSFFYFVTGEPYFTTLVLSYLFVIGALFLLVYKISNTKVQGYAIVICLLFSKSFIDYTSSGLENPLSYFIIAMFLYSYFAGDTSKRLLKLSIVAALGAINRLDLILLFLPVLLFEIFKGWNYKKLLTLVVGFLPLIIWELFSLLYYGLLFPNTAYSKLNISVGAGELFVQGLHYLENSILTDPNTMLMVLFSSFVIIKLARNNKGMQKYAMPALGAFLYIIYTIKIGADFMSGRFLAVPLFLLIAIISNIEFKKISLYQTLLLALVLLVGLLNFNSPIYSTPSYGKQRVSDENNKSDNPWYFHPFVDKYGIADERKFWYSTNGFIPVLKAGKGEPIHPNIDEGKKTKISPYKTIYKKAIGMFGFYAGPKVHVIDYYALGDAFLARLPNNPKQYPSWRIGHFERKMPVGYFETIESGKNQIADKNLSILYDKISIVTKGRIFDWQRLAEVININTAKYNYLIPTTYESVQQSLYPFSGDSLSIAKWYNDIGLYYYNSMESDSAIKYYNQATEYFPKYTMPLRNLFLLYNFYKKYDKAFEYLLQLIAKGDKPEKINKFFIDWDKSLRAEGRTDDAKLTLKKWISIDPKEPLAYTNLGTYYIMENKKTDAVYMWNKAIEADPGYKHAYILLFNYYFNENQLDSANVMADKALAVGAKLEPNALAKVRNSRK